MILIQFKKRKYNIYMKGNNERIKKKVESSRFITVINTIRIESNQNRIDHLKQKCKENNNNITVSTINKNERKWNGMNESKG